MASLPGLRFVSVYRRSTEVTQVNEFNTSLCSDCAAIGNSKVVILGDFNNDPLIDSLNVLAACFGATVEYPTFAVSIIGTKMSITMIPLFTSPIFLLCPPPPGGIAKLYRLGPGVGALCVGQY